MAAGATGVDKGGDGGGGEGGGAGGGGDGGEKVVVLVAEEMVGETEVEAKERGWRGLVVEVMAEVKAG